MILRGRNFTRVHLVIQIKQSIYICVRLYFFANFSELSDQDKEKENELAEDWLLIARIREERQKILAASSLLPSNEKRNDAYKRLVEN